MSIPTPALHPERYRAPGDGVTVATTAALIKALAGPERVILLASGIYDHASVVRVPAGKAIWSKKLHGAALRVGLQIDGVGVRLGGLHVQPRGAAVTTSGACVYAGAVAHLTVTDCDLTGAGSLRAGLMAYQSSALTVERCRASAFTDYGFFHSTYSGKKTVPAGFVTQHLADLISRNVERRTPGSANGTAEANVWMGVPTVATRLMGSNAGWMNFWTGAAFAHSNVANLHASAARVGLYLEHLSLDSTFAGAVIYPRHTGVNCEWNDGHAGNGASQRNTLRNLQIHGGLVGVYMDQGTAHTHVVDSTLYGQRVAGIVDYKGIGNGYSGVVFEDWRDGVPRITTQHVSSAALRLVDPPGPG